MKKKLLVAHSICLLSAMDTTPKICVRFGTYQLPVLYLRKSMDGYNNFDILPNHPFPLEGIIDDYDLIIFVVDESFKNSFGYELVSSKIGEHIVENNKKCIIMQLDFCRNKCYSFENFDEDIIEIPYMPKLLANVIPKICHRIEVKKATEHFSKRQKIEKEIE